ncbi:MAG TPA: circadian clock KaiB family protein [Puia sp.]|nr:circadian clock KaiB family protein [Puia sp.]
MKGQNYNERQGSGKEPTYVFHLFVAGASPNSTRAIANLQGICEQYLKGRYVLEVVDVYQQAERAKKEELVALPMLIKRSPSPERKFIGDLSDRPKVLKGLGLTV